MENLRPYSLRSFNVRSIYFAMMLSFGCLSGQQWNASLEKALKEASASDQKVLLYFSVHEACQICRELEEKVFASEEFQAFTSGRYVLARPDFKETDSFEEKAGKLIIVEKYNKDGFFPLVVILDKNSRVLGKTGVYKGETAGEYINVLKSIGNP